MLSILCALALFAFLLYALSLILYPIRRQLIQPATFLGLLLIIKLVSLLSFSGFWWDVSCFTTWAEMMAREGLFTIYQPHPGVAQMQGLYPPTYQYALWVAGHIVSLTGATGDLERMIIGTPVMLADFFIALLMFAFVAESHAIRTAWLTMLAVAFNPAMLFDSTIWQQCDPVFMMFLFLAVLLILAEYYAIAWGIIAMAVLIKPQALSLIPVLAAWTLVYANKRELLWCAISGLLIVIVTVLPWQIHQPWLWLPKFYLTLASLDQETSVNAFNFMGLVGGLRNSDHATITITNWAWQYSRIGIELLIVLYASLVYALVRSPTRHTLWFTLFLSALGGWLFATRMHERYVLLSVLLVIPLAVDSLMMLTVGTLLTFVNFIQLFYVYSFAVGRNLDAHDPFAMLLASVNLGIFFLVVGCFVGFFHHKQHPL